MSVIIGKLSDGYHLLFEELPDPRTKTWFLVAKPYQILTILGIYLMFIFKWGPQWMKGRPAFNLDKIMIAYNILQVLACLTIFIRSIQLAWGAKYKWICEPVDTSTSAEALGIAGMVYNYYLTKIIDLIDTVFFVLRKKNRQVSFLHVYHHTGMAALVWGGVTYLPGGHATLVGVINCFVHVIMYTYYLYTVAVPSAKNSIWWKKHITQLQIVQFFWCVVHMSAIIFKSDCGYPRWVSAIFLPQNFFVLIMFLDFYIKTYIQKPKQQKADELKNKHKKENGHTKENGFKNGVQNEPTGTQNKVDGLNTLPEENGLFSHKKIE